MTDILKNSTFHLYWYDESQTILCLHVYERWGWDAAYLAIERISAAAASISHDFYTVFHFEKSSAMLPSSYAIPNVRNMMVNTPNEQMILLVNANRFLEIILGMAGQGMPMFRKIHFTSTLERALEIIAQHKATLNVKR
jgi:hypothetical protein